MRPRPTEIPGYIAANLGVCRYHAAVDQPSHPAPALFAWIECDGWQG